MKPSRVSSTAAEKALARAVEDATADLRGQLARANVRIRELEGTLGRIEAQARNAQPKVDTLQPVTTTPAPFAEPVASPVVDEDVTVPQGPSVELDPGDNLGPGRWS